MVLQVKPCSSVKPHSPDPTARTAIAGRIAWLSGGTGGLGLTFGAALLAHGCAGLAIADVVDDAAGQAAVQQLRDALPRGSQQRVDFHRVDVRDARQVRRSMRHAAAAFGGLHIVINNAGVADEGDVERTVATNLVAVVTATVEALRVFEEVGESEEGAEGVGGRGKVIVNVASAGGLFAMPVAPVYAASKHGVVGYTRSMRNACLERGVRINCYCPGWASVGMGKMVKREGKAARLTGIMSAEEVGRPLLEILRREDLVGEAVYASETAGVRLVRMDMGRTLGDLRCAKL